jgi:hypothetical protein
MNDCADGDFLTSLNEVLGPSGLETLTHVMSCESCSSTLSDLEALHAAAAPLVPDAGFEIRVGESLERLRPVAAPLARRGDYSRETRASLIVGVLAMGSTFLLLSFVSWAEPANATQSLPGLAMASLVAGAFVARRTRVA